MDHGNRFAPPATTVADVGSAAVQPIRFWPPDGRIGRLRFLAYGLALYVLFVLASFVFGFVAAIVSRGSGGSGGSALLTVVAFLGFALYLVAEFVLIIQRSHDMNLSGWWGIAALVPLVGLFWVLKGGTRGANRFGAPPPPNTVAVNIFGWLLPLVVVIGIAAAVALPAYQQYATRAAAGASR